MSLLWLSLLMTSCLKTEVINAIEPEEHEAVVEKRKKPLPEKPEQTDTTRVPIETVAGLRFFFGAPSSGITRS